MKAHVYRDSTMAKAFVRANLTRSTQFNGDIPDENSGIAELREFCKANNLEDEVVDKRYKSAYWSAINAFIHAYDGAAERPENILSGVPGTYTVTLNKHSMTVEVTLHGVKNNHARKVPVLYFKECSERHFLRGDIRRNSDLYLTVGALNAENYTVNRRIRISGAIFIARARKWLLEAMRKTGVDIGSANPYWSDPPKPH